MALADRGARSDLSDLGRGGVTRQGVLVERLPAGRLPATRFAAGAANHLLPTGLGASAVNPRFMTVCGVPLPRSSAALALYLLAESVVRVGLPPALRAGPLLPDGTSTPVPIAAVVTASGAVAPVLLARRLRTAVFRFVRTALGEARSIHARPTRVPALWGESPAFPELQAGVLVAVGPALGLDIPVAHMALARLAATVAVALVPTPDGLGSVEAATVEAPVAAGGPPTAATAVVPAFRIITVRLPLLPGALTLGVPVRLKVIRRRVGHPHATPTGGGRPYRGAHPDNSSGRGARRRPIRAGPVPISRADTAG
jgi:hypothetical protein